MFEFGVLLLGGENMIIKSETIDLNGRELVLRNATEDDAQMLLDYLKTTCGETRFLLKEPEEITLTLEQEKDFIRNGNESETNVMILGFLDGEYVGNCSLMGKRLIRQKHRASMGIALYQKFTGMGIGTAMIEKLIEIATEKGYEQLELEVVANNEKAIHLYKKMGFEIYGTFKDTMKYPDGTYADEYWMMRKL